MAPLTFRLPMSAEDVHPYMDFLFVLNGDGELLVIDWPTWSQEVLGQVSVPGIDAFAALARNTELGQEPIHWSGSQPIELPPLTDHYVLNRINLNVGRISDWLIYNRTLYFATRNAVIEMPLWINGAFDGADKPRVVIEAPALQLRARFGVIVGACGDAGIHPRRVYSWSEQGEAARLPRLQDPVMEYTSRVDWMHSDLLRIGMENEASVIVNSSVNIPLQYFERERSAIHAFATRETGRNEFMELNERFHSGFASLNTAYFWKGNHVFRLGGSQGRRRVTKEFDVVSARSIYDARSFAGGLVFDTDQGTYFTDAFQPAPHLVSPEENIVMRVFNNARYYVRQIWSLKADHLDITVV